MKFALSFEKEDTKIFSAGHHPRAPYLCRCSYFPHWYSLPHRPWICKSWSSVKGTLYAHMWEFRNDMLLVAYDSPANFLKILRNVHTNIILRWNGILNLWTDCVYDYAKLHKIWSNIPTIIFVLYLYDSMERKSDISCYLGFSYKILGILVMTFTSIMLTVWFDFLKFFGLSYRIEYWM